MPLPCGKESGRTSNPEMLYVPYTLLLGEGLELQKERTVVVYR